MPQQMATDCSGKARRHPADVYVAIGQEGIEARVPAGNLDQCSPHRGLPLGGTLTLLGELEPIARQLFVAPFAFFLPATIGKLSAFCRLRTESFRLAVRRLNLARPITGGEQIHGHDDLRHLPPVHWK
jgi:hypothetical protein